MSIAEIREMFGRKDLIVNKDYQRHSDIWPPNAKSYFIDTILNGYPFPKVYFYESLIGQTKKIRREIVDGQQRITTIIDFANDGFTLTNASLTYRGLQFSNMGDENQNKFLSYSVPVDMIIAAERSEILEMFRRMNSYTQPLNAAEKRHSDYSGEFKWFVNELSDEYSPMLVNFGVLTQKQIVRMGDSELLTEISQLIITGIVNKSDSVLDRLYKNNDQGFEKKNECDEKIHMVLNFIRENLGDFANGFLFKPYVFYSLCAALMYNRWASPKWDANLPEPSNRFWSNAEMAKAGLAALSSAHETQELGGPFAEYVIACMSSTHRYAQRQTRANWLLRAINGNL
jgi:hypothetical protein